MHCKLCFDSGNKKRAQVKYCGGTTNLTLHLKTWHKADYKAMVEKEEPPKKPPSILLNDMVLYLRHIGNISASTIYRDQKNISSINISAIYRDWLHSLGTRSAGKFLKVASTTADPPTKCQEEVIGQIKSADMTGGEFFCTK